jgi:hypothetical protein
VKLQLPPVGRAACRRAAGGLLLRKKDPKMSTANTITAPAHSIDDPLRVAARQANQLWRGLRDAYVESAAAGEQAVLEGLLESAVAIEHRLYRLAACPVLHPRVSP